MTTASNAIKACIEDNWNPATGGTEPTVYTSTEGSMWPTEEEWIFVKNWEYGKRRKRRNDSFVKEDDYVGIRVYTRNHADKEERLDEMVNELYDKIKPANVAGYHKVDIIDQHRRSSDRRQKVYAADLIVELKILSTSATATPGAVANSTAEFDELTVNTSIAGNPTAALGETTVAGSVRINDTGAGPFLSTGTTTDTTDPMALLRFKIEREWMFRKRSTGASTRLTLESDTDGKYFWIGYDDGVIYCAKFGVHDVQEDCTVQLGHNVTIDNNLTVGGTVTGATSAQIDDLLMFGSANAAWVPCSALATSITALEMKTAVGYIVNPDGQDPWLGFTLPLPTTKGSLKLYVTGFRAIVNAANATNFLSLVRIYGVTETAATLIEPTGNGTDRTAQGDYEYALANTDMSGYDYVVAYLIITVADASALKLGPPLLECYYAA